MVLVGGVEVQDAICDWESREVIQAQFSFLPQVCLRK